MSVYVDIRKQIGAFHLDVAFEADHETLSLLGDSGCGKSMTLRCIAGIVRPDEGIIRINDNVVFDSSAGIDLKPQKRRVGYLFQNYALFPNMTVVENIMAGMEREKALNRVQKREKAEEFVHRLQLDGLEGNYPAQLSGGQQQRTALARILASNPDALLLDEPFSALDATLRWEMEQVVRSTISDFKGTALLVTHDRDEVYRLSDKVAVYKNGRVDVLAEKWALFSNPKTATSARLTGCKNLSPIRIEGNRIISDQWQISFPLKQAGDWNWLGIRAHNLCLCEEGEENSFPFEVVNRIEDTFSYIFQIRRRGAADAGLIRWETDKKLGAAMPDFGFVQVPETELLLLHE